MIYAAAYLYGFTVSAAFADFVFTVQYGVVDGTVVREISKLIRMCQSSI
jgi:hypothetical protein